MLHSGKPGFDAVMLERGWLVAESVMLNERKEVAGPDDYPTDPDLQNWVHERKSLLMGDQKVRVTHPRLRHVVHGEELMQSYLRLQRSDVSPENDDSSKLEYATGFGGPRRKERIDEAVEVFRGADRVCNPPG
jgi:hypothetical protein